MRIFCDVLKENEAEFVKLNDNIEDLGSHSARKGSSTLCASGCTVAPPITSICLCAGWSMGTVKSRYLRHEVAGDQFCGCTVTGLNPCTTDFSASCCYFEIDGEDHNKELHKYVSDVVTSGNLLSSSTFIIVNFLLATLYFRYDYLCTHLHPSSRLRVVPVFMAPPSNLLRAATFKFP